MRCVRAKRLLHLNREGELPGSLKEKVLRHAAQCPTCGAELELIERTEKVLTSLRNDEPVLDNPGAMTAAVMRLVQGVPSGRREGWSGAKLSLLLSARAQHGIQFACALFALAFLVQSTLDAHRMVALEDRLAEHRLPAPKSGDISLRSFSSVRDERGIISALLSASPRGVVPSPGQSVREAGVALKVEDLRIGPLGTTAVMDRLRAKYPALFSISLDDGLDAQKRAILATEGRAFLNEVEQLVKMGEASYER